MPTLIDIMFDMGYLKILEIRLKKTLLDLVHLVSTVMFLQPKKTLKINIHHATSVIVNKY